MFRLLIRQDLHIDIKFDIFKQYDHSKSFLYIIFKTLEQIDILPTIQSLEGILIHLFHQDHENQMSLYQQLEMELTKKSSQLHEKEDVEIQVR